MQTRKVYFISGLGADWRLFGKIVLPGLYRIIHIRWVPPQGHETIRDYAARLSHQIDTSEPFYLVGFSFGGMVAAELTRLLHPAGTIIISSAPTARGLPWYYKLAGFLRLPGLVPVGLLKAAVPLTYWFFGARTKEEKALLRQVVKDADPGFLKWALQAVTTWKTTAPPVGLFHIHGAADKVLPLRFIRPDHILPGGEHLMVYSQAASLSRLLAEKLNSF